MIRDLAISNLGVIVGTRLEFGGGLTVLTGETGAGKTLITTALGLLLGDKPDPGLVRHGASEAVVECTIAVADDPTLARLAELGSVIEDGEVVLTRTIGSRSRAVVGARSAAASVLAELFSAGVTVHGQHGQVRLTRGADQRALLDAATPGASALLPVVRAAWANLRSARTQLDEARAASAEDGRRLAELRALVDDVSGVDPAADELDRLDARIARLAAAEAIERAVRTGTSLLVDGDTVDLTDAVALLAQVRRLLEPYATEAPFATWLASLSEAQESLQDTGHAMVAFLDDLEADDTSIDELMTRKAAINGLLRRWGGTLPQLLERAGEAARTLALADDPEGQLLHLQALLEHCEAELERACSELHALRQAAASVLAEQVSTELQALGLVHARFQVTVERQGAPAQHGDDAVEFRFSANPGQPPQSLAHVASGGELSRVMLALESVAAGDAASTFVFDEIDAGIGGRAALEVGRRLAQLARHHQVIVVTHLAQVAAFADHHVVVEKQVSAGETITTARTLGQEERPRELTRLLSGVEDSAAATAHAVELLELAAAARAGDR